MKELHVLTQRQIYLLVNHLTENPGLYNNLWRDEVAAQVMEWAQANLDPEDVPTGLSVAQITGLMKSAKGSFKYPWHRRRRNPASVKAPVPESRGWDLIDQADFMRRLQAMDERLERIERTLW
jgi:hypothetical protein